MSEHIPDSLKRLAERVWKHYGFDFAVRALTLNGISRTDAVRCVEAVRDEAKAKEGEAT